MKPFFVYFLAQISVTSLSTSNQKSNKISFDVLSNLTNTFVDPKKEVMFVNYDSEMSSVFGQVFEKINLPHKIRNFRKDNLPIKIDDSGILLFNSITSVKDFNSKVKLTNVYPKKFQFFVHYKNATIDEIASLQDTTILQYQYFLVEEEEIINLMTFVWYTSG